MLKCVHTRLYISSAVVAQNALSDKCHIMLSNTRCAAFAQLIIFTCLTFPAAQCGLGSFTSVKKLLQTGAKELLAPRLTYLI